MVKGDVDHSSAQGPGSGHFKQKGPGFGGPSQEGNGGEQSGGFQSASTKMTSKAPTMPEDNGAVQFLKQSLKDIPQQYAIMNDRIE